MQAIELYIDGVQIGEIGQEDVFSMDDFEVTSCSKDQTRVMNTLGQFTDPYNSVPSLPKKPAVTHSSRGGVTFQIEDEDDFMCPYEQTQASNYFNCDMKNNKQQQKNRLDEDVLSDIFSDDCCDTEAGSPPFILSG